MSVLFWKTTAAVMIAVVLILTLEKQERDLALLLRMAVCVMTGIAVFAVWEPVLDFLFKLSEFGTFQSDVLTILMKITGIGIVSELARVICTDSGNASLAHGIQLLGSAMILLLSLPILETLLELVQQIVGEL